MTKNNPLILILFCINTLFVSTAHSSQIEEALALLRETPEATDSIDLMLQKFRTSQPDDDQLLHAWLDGVEKKQNLPQAPLAPLQSLLESGKQNPDNNFVLEPHGLEPKQSFLVRLRRLHSTNPSFWKACLVYTQRLICSH